MQPKDIIFNTDVQNKIKSGVNKLADTVSATMGPRGRNVLIERTHGQPPVITKDGVSVALEVFLEDPVENMAAQLIKDVASKTADEAGDGTTTATVLARAIYNSGLKQLSSGSNPVELKRGIDKAVQAIVEKLKEESIEITSTEHIKQVATISANGDTLIGDIIARAMEAVGKDGVIDVEQGTGFEDTLEVVQGMKIERGYASPYFINNNNGNVLFEEPKILLVNDRLTETRDIVKILEHCASNKKPLLIIAKDFEQEVLNTLAVNTARNIVNVCAIKAPGLGTDIIKQLEDISVITGAKIYSSEMGEPVKNASTNELGTIDKVIVTKSTTSFIGSKTDDAVIAKYVESLYKDKEEQTNDYMREHVQKRIARVSGGVAILRIGAHSEVESKEKHDRIDDALSATRAALSEGIVIGGGCSLLKIAHSIDNTLTGDEYHGAEIVRAATKAPLTQIVENAGKPIIIVDKVLEQTNKNVGYDAFNDKLVDMIDAGIIDPAKVERVALQQAASVASLLLTTEASISFTKLDK